MYCGDNHAVKRVLTAVIGIPVLLYLAYQGVFSFTGHHLNASGSSQFRNIIKKSHCQTLAVHDSALCYSVIYLVQYQFIINIFFFMVFYGYFLLNYPEYTFRFSLYTFWRNLYFWGFSILSYSGNWPTALVNSLCLPDCLEH